MLIRQRLALAAALVAAHATGASSEHEQLTTPASCGAMQLVSVAACESSSELALDVTRFDAIYEGGDAPVVPDGCSTDENTDKRETKAAANPPSFLLLSESIGLSPVAVDARQQRGLTADAARLRGGVERGEVGAVRGQVARDEIGDGCVVHA